MIDTNMLYLVIGGFIAIVFAIALFKSDFLRGKVTKKGFGIETGKGSKTVTTIKGIKNNAYVDVKQDIIPNHTTETAITDVNDATAVLENKKPLS